MCTSMEISVISIATPTMMNLQTMTTNTSEDLY
jgi:hypothetical protein